MILWIFDYCTSRVRKINLSEDLCKELHETYGEEFLLAHEEDFDIKLEDIHWMFTNDDVELEEENI